jgi:hypothetical protein
MILETVRDTHAAPPVPTGDLEVRVRGRIRGYVRDFRLVAAANGVILRGSARSYYAKQLAQQAVMGAAPLPILANEIEVFSPPDGEREHAGVE